MAMTEERDMLEVVRAAARARSVARREMRERVLRQRQRLAGTLQDSRRDLGQQLLSAAGLGQAELDSMRKREEETVRTFLEEERRAIAGRPRPTGLGQPLRLTRRSPFPDAPQLGFKLVQLDTASLSGLPSIKQEPTRGTWSRRIPLRQDATLLGHSQRSTAAISLASTPGT